MSTACLIRRTIEPSYRPTAPISTSRDFVTSPSPEFTALIREVAKLTNLPVNWDLEGGLPVSQDAALSSLPVLRLGAELGVIAHVMPLSDGALLAEWHYGDRLLQIEWSPAGAGEYDYAELHELRDEGPLPHDPRGLFLYLLGGRRAD